MMLRFSLLQLVGLVSLAGLASAALVHPGPGWLSVVVTLTVAVIAGQTLRAVLLVGEARAAAIGWLLFAVAYLALAVGPWLGEQVGPSLLSSKGLAYAQVQWRKESSEEAYSADYLRRLSLDLTGVPTIYDGTSNTLVWTTEVNVNTWGYGQPSGLWWPVNAAAASPVNCFRVSGHWLFAWVAGWLGAAIAVMLQRRSER
jgi:hypothetical protein